MTAMQARRRAQQARCRARTGVAAALIAIGSVASCTESRPPAARHLVLVTIDTLRADRVGVYGGGELTPRLDRIARVGA
jgi:hypothetical protein